MHFHTTWGYTALACLALFAAACEVPTKVAGVNSGLSRLVVSPKIASLRTTQSLDLMVVALSSSGDTAPATVSWSVTIGSLTDTSTNGGRHYGRYRPGAATGTFNVIATGNPGAKADTAVVTVMPVPVQSVTVAPATVSVVAATTAQLSATTLDSAGTPLGGRVVTWATSNAAVATVSGSGLVIGVTAGSATVTATSEGKSGTSTVTVTPAPVASVSVSPASVSVTAGQTVQLTATPRDANGTALAGRVVTWSSGNTAAATVSGSGLVTAVAAGSVTVTATSEGQSGSSAITVTQAPAPVASVSVTPASASVTAGQTVQLTATPRDANGTALAGRVVTWSSGSTAAATVSGSGLVTGVAAGSATITATSEGKGGTAAITVTAASGGGTVLFQESFEDNAFASRGWYDNTSPVTTSAQHIPGSTRALEMHFTAGSLTPVSGGSARHLFTATTTLYISYWVKYSTNWVGSAHPYHPHEFLVLSDLDGDYDGPSNSWLVAYVEHNYQNGGIPRLALQDSKAINTSFGTPPVNLSGVTENRSTCGCNGVVESNIVTTCFSFPPWYNDKELIASQVWFQPNPGPGYKGDWNHVEAYFQLNSVVGGVGVADGVMQYWFNGTLVIDRHDILLRTGARPTIRFHQFMIAPYIGDGSPVDQYMWVDDLTVATARP